MPPLSLKTANRPRLEANSRFTEIRKEAYMAAVNSNINLGGPWGPTTIEVVDTFSSPGIRHAAVAIDRDTRINGWDPEPLRDLAAALTEAADRLEANKAMSASVHGGAL